MILIVLFLSWGGIHTLCILTLDNIMYKFLFRLIINFNENYIKIKKKL